jgi:hypothetical protein
MNRNEIIAAIDQEIARLQSARAALTAGHVDGTRRKYTRSATPRRHHRLTAEGRRRLSQMMKRRWAERRKAAKSK